MINLKESRIALIGAGNMAEAIVKGITARGLVTPANIVATDIFYDKLVTFQNILGTKIETNNKKAVHDADIVIFAIKPQHVIEVAKEIKPVFHREKLLISIAAGISTRLLEKTLGAETRLVRAMPNTPALVGAGATAICPGRWALPKDVNATEEIFAAVGTVVRVEESHMDAITALSASGPAYVFFLLEIMQEAARRMNLEKEIAHQLIFATVEGAAKLAKETGLEAAELRRKVTSKGGTTEAAFKRIEEARIFDHFVEAILEARSRALQLQNIEGKPSAL